MASREGRITMTTQREVTPIMNLLQNENGMVTDLDQINHNIARCEHTIRLLKVRTANHWEAQQRVEAVSVAACGTMREIE